MAEPLEALILVADDDEMNRLVAVESLRYMGATVVDVDSGARALDALALLDFDLLLMDVHMPEMSGIEATLRIRAQALATGSRRIPIVALTASATDTDRAACLAAGMDGVLTKPYRIEELQAVVRAWCEPG